LGITSVRELRVDYPILQAFCHHGWMGGSTWKRFFLELITSSHFIVSTPKLKNPNAALPNPLIKHLPALVCITQHKHLEKCPRTATYRIRPQSLK